MTLERTIVSRINAHPVSTINFAVVSFKRTSVSIAHAPQHQLKEELRLIMKMPSDQAKEMLKLSFGEHLTRELRQSGSLRTRLSGTWTASSTRFARFEQRP